MTDAPTPIELAPKRRASPHPMLHAIRTGAQWVHLALALAIVLGVFVQVYLIGAYIFGAGQGLLDAHRASGFIVQGLEVVLFLAALAAWLPRRDLLLSLLLAVIGSIQAGLANAHRWLGGLHPLLALVVLTLAAMLALRATRRVRATNASARSAHHAPPLEAAPPRQHAQARRHLPNKDPPASGNSAPRTDQQNPMPKQILFIGGGLLGSAAGVIGALISDPRVGFPAWVDLTGVVAGFGLGALVTGIALLLRYVSRSPRDDRPA